MTRKPLGGLPALIALSHKPGAVLSTTAYAGNQTDCSGGRGEAWLGPVPCPRVPILRSLPGAAGIPTRSTGPRGAPQKRPRCSGHTAARHDQPPHGLPPPARGRHPPTTPNHRPRAAAPARPATGGGAERGPGSDGREARPVLSGAVLPAPDAVPR